MGILNRYGSKYGRNDVEKEENEIREEKRTGNIKDRENKMTRGFGGEHLSRHGNGPNVTRGGILGGHAKHGGHERGVAFGGHTNGIGSEGVVRKYGTGNTHLHLGKKKDSFW